MPNLMTQGRRGSAYLLWAALLLLPTCIDVQAADMTLVMQEHGEEGLLKTIGVEPTGMPFNSVMAVELHKSAVNPLVNAGAMTSVSLVKAASPDERWEKILAMYKKFAGAKLPLNQDVYKYTNQCSVGITAKQLATMGTTLANDGINPVSGDRAAEAKFVPRILAVMMMAGFYDEAGLWAWKTGLSAKTGVGGGIAVSLQRSPVSLRLPRSLRRLTKQGTRLGLNVFGVAR